MSIAYNTKDIKPEISEKIHKDLEIKLESKFGGSSRFNSNPVRYIYPYQVLNEIIILPFAYTSSVLKLDRRGTNEFDKMNVTFEKDLRPEQKLVKKEAIKHLNNTGSVLLSMYCGFGKSATSMKIACSIGLKTLIIVNKLVLIKQWEEGIKNFCPSAVIQKLSTKSKFNNEADFYIINAQNIEKLGNEFFESIGTVIVDEAHMIMAETLSRSMQYLYPRYLIGLTATPYRPDGLNVLLDIYFGKNKIIRTLSREHTVYKIDTGFTPEVELTVNNRVNWGAILDSQAKDEDRNDIILTLIQYFSDRNILVLVKRISQGNYLVKKLQKEGESVTSLLGNNQEFDKNARILIGTSNKIGVGFDHPRLDTLLLAADIEEYFIQYLGRVFRTKDVEPIILDLVDDNSILEKHWKTRKKVYEKHSGKIKNLELS